MLSPETEVAPVSTNFGIDSTAIKVLHRRSGSSSMAAAGGGKSASSTSLDLLEYPLAFRC